MNNFNQEYAFSQTLGLTFKRKKDSSKKNLFFFRKYNIVSNIRVSYK